MKPIRALLTACLLLSAPMVPAETPDGWHEDAFGLYRPGSDPARDGWAGLRTGPARHRQPPGPVTELHFIAGPKSVPAGKDRVHLVALGIDAAGNLVADGEEIRVAPGQGGRVTRRTIGGIADLLHDPGTVARGFVAGAETATVQSGRATYRVIADLASVRPAIAAVPPVLSETQVALSLPALQDRFGNPVEDGTGLMLWLRDGQGHGIRLDAETTGGAGRAQFLVRQVTGQLIAQVHLGATAGARRGIDSLPLRPEGALLARSEPLAGIGAQRLVVGPFRTAEGHVLADGVAVRLSVTAPGGEQRVADTWVRDGMADTVLPWPQGEAVTVRVQSPLGDATIPATIVPEEGS